MDKILVFTIAMLAFVVQAEAAMHGGGGHGGGGHGGGFHGGGFHGGGGMHGGFHGGRHFGRGFHGGGLGWYPCNPALLTLGQCPYEYGY